MNEQENTNENDKEEGSEQETSPKTKIDNVENPEGTLQFDHLLKSTSSRLSSSRSSKHPFIRSAGIKSTPVKRRPFSSFLKSTSNPS